MVFVILLFLFVVALYIIGWVHLSCIDVFDAALIFLYSKLVWIDKPRREWSFVVLGTIGATKKTLSVRLFATKTITLPPPKIYII